MFARRGYPPFPQAPSAGEPLHEPEQLARPRHAPDLELSGDDRAVPEEPAEERLLDLDRADLREPNCRRTAADEAVDDDELVAGHEDVRAIPAPDGRDRHPGGDDEQDGARHRGGPAEHEPDRSDRRERPRTGERPQEDDPVAALVEVDRLLRFGKHRGCTLRQKRQDPSTWAPRLAARRSLGLSPAASSSPRLHLGRSRSSSPW